jgi:hypothetical protein
VPIRKNVGDDEIIEKAYLRSVKNYVPRPKPDQSLHSPNGIQKCVAISSRFDSQIVLLERNSRQLRLFDRLTLKFAALIELTDVITPIGCPSGLLGGAVAKQTEDFGIPGLDDVDSKFMKLEFGADHYLVPKRASDKQSRRSINKLSQNNDNPALKTIILDICSADVRKVVG